MSVNPLARLLEGADAVVAELERRADSAVDHPADAAAEIAPYHPKRIGLTVSEVIEETPSTKTFRLRRPDGTDLPPFVAGQYISLDVTVGDVLTNRAFSLSSSPSVRDSYDVTVRRLRGGRVSNHLVDNVAVGDRFTSGGPMGAFCHDPLFHGDDVIFLAGGSGVAPAMSMIRDVVDRGLSRRVTLLYGSRQADDIIFRDELDAIAREHPNIVVHHILSAPDPSWTGAVGPLDAKLIESLVGPPAGRMTYLCGASYKYAYLVRQLTSLGQPTRRIRMEANYIAQPPPQDPRWPADVDPKEEVTVSVRGRKKIIMPRGRALLDELENNGIRPEASCRSGECGDCRFRILSGDVYHAEEARLRVSDQHFGFGHSCVAFPLTDLEIEV